MSYEQALQIKEMDDTPFDIDTKLPMYPYQKVGAYFMLAVKKCFNLDDPGMGKTIQSIGYIKLLQKLLKKSNVKVLVATTSSVVYQWESEVKKFSNLLPVVIDGSKARRTNDYTNFAKDRRNVMIINHTKVLHDFDKIRAVKWDAIIIDEASALKDRSTAMYKYYDYLAKAVDRFVLLTATPISNNLEEFYNLFQLFQLNFLPEYPEFRERFLITKPVTVKKPGGAKFTIQSVVGSKNITEFRELIEPFFIRRENTKEGEFKNLKMLNFKHPIPLTMEQKTLCATLRTQFFKEEDAIALKVYSNFIKISCAPVIYAPEYSNFSPKAIELCKLIKSLKDKVVVFAKYLEFHEIIRDYFDKAGISYVSITGEQNPKEKDINKAAFREDPDIQVILLTGAGKFGLNLQTSNRIIFVDMPYTPSDVFQYIGRVYRTGQVNDVFVHFLYSSNTLEEDLFASLERKQSEIDEFFQQEKADIFKLDIPNDVDVKSSFLGRNYLEGESYDSIASKDDYSLIPEKKSVAPKMQDTEEELWTIGSIEL